MDLPTRYRVIAAGAADAPTLYTTRLEPNGRVTAAWTENFAFAATFTDEAEQLALAAELQEVGVRCRPVILEYAEGGENQARAGKGVRRGWRLLPLPAPAPAATTDPEPSPAVRSLMDRLEALFLGRPKDWVREQADSARGGQE